ncbi:hypothetical protein EDD18DRAFT_1107788 [Armillaria luteobubalina]|uniref:Uncharacterized protein n=1 Tax=Armillaria luteobubalina TaxID=153913 RepID=A0AA39UM56_9AGAR|nr:hypothetical protein EDD18DRAFT_1107788 [Armillaria luteobubalina]
MARPKLYHTAEEKKEAARARRLEYYYQNRKRVLKNMKRKYASKARREREGKPAKAKAKGEQETYAHGSLLFLSLRHKADFQITLLVRTICMEGGKLTALTSNSLPSYAARLCKDAMLTGEGGEIERALEHLEGMCTEVQVAHDRIYSAAGICKEWTDMQEMVNRFDGAIKVLQDILCHILEGDLREAWQGHSLAYQQH